jgi:hypothetical protein
MPISLFVHRRSGIQHNARLGKFLRKRFCTVIVRVNEVPEDVVSGCPHERGEDTLVTDASVAPNTIYAQKSSQQSYATGYTISQQEAIGLVRIYVYIGLEVDRNSILRSQSRIHTGVMISLKRHNWHKVAYVNDGADSMLSVMF